MRWTKVLSVLLLSVIYDVEMFEVIAFDVYMFPLPSHFSKLWFCIHFLVKSSSFHSNRYWMHESVSLADEWTRIFFDPPFVESLTPFDLQKLNRSNRSNDAIEQFLPELMRIPALYPLSNKLGSKISSLIYFL